MIKSKIQKNHKTKNPKNKQKIKKKKYRVRVKSTQPTSPHETDSKSDR